MSDAPPIQLIANVVVHDGIRVLLTRYDATAGEAPDDVRWWLPGAELEPYEHPDAVAQAVVEGFAGLEAEAPVLAAVQSFRGRRGWHVTFDYAVRATGEPVDDEGRPVGWFAVGDLPRTKHGSWEREVIEQVLSRSA